MAAGYEEDWSGFHEGPGARPVFSMGEDSIAANGERSCFLLMIARWACIPFGWLGGIVCYLWARDLYGRPAGVLACLLWSFSPNILAHASLITADAHATALGLAACYTFWRWLKRPTWTQAALTGLVLGLAELAKTTLILFYPIWPLLWVVYRLGSGSFFARRSVNPPENFPAKKVPDPLPTAKPMMTPQDWLREAGMLLVRMAIGIYVLNLGYGFAGTLKPLGDYHFVSELFIGNGDTKKNDEYTSLTRNSQPAPSNSTNRFTGTWLGYLPVPFPKNYLLGIDIQQRDFEHYGRPSYLRGVWQDHGWWYYYLYAVAIKVPLGTWMLGLLVVLLSVTGRLGGTPWRDEMVLLVPAVIIFTVVSSKTGFNEHMRYVLPCFPFVFVWLGKISRIYLTRDGQKEYVARRPIGANGLIRLAMGRLVPAMLVAWLVAGSLWIYPHSLSYFNESIGGPLNGPEHLLGSNVDWGQDVLYLSDLLRDQAMPVNCIHATRGQAAVTALDICLNSPIASEAQNTHAPLLAFSINMIDVYWDIDVAVRKSGVFQALLAIEIDDQVESEPYSIDVPVLIIGVGKQF